MLNVPGASLETLSIYIKSLLKRRSQHHIQTPFQQHKYYFKAILCVGTPTSGEGPHMPTFWSSDLNGFALVILTYLR